MLCKAHGSYFCRMIFGGCFGANYPVFVKFPATGQFNFALRVKPIQFQGGFARGDYPPVGLRSGTVKGRRRRPLTSGAGIGRAQLPATPPLFNPGLFVWSDCRRPANGVCPGGVCQKAVALHQKPRQHTALMRQNFGARRFQTQKHRRRHHSTLGWFT